jgi:hypothetical protein
MFCQKCGAENPDGAAFCNSCGAALKPVPELRTSVKPQLFGFKKSQIIGFVGCLCLIIGCFTPLVSVPIIGSFNYFHNGSGDGILILAFALISGIALIFRKYIKILFLTGLTSLGIVIYDFFNISNTVSNIQSTNFGMFNFLASSIQIEYGWAFLIIGSILIIVTALLELMAPKEPVSSTNEGTSVDSPNEPQKKHGTAFWAAAIIGIIIVIIIGAAVIGSLTYGGAALTNNWSKYCSDNYPGSVFNTSSNMCEKITPLPTMQYDSLQITDKEGVCQDDGSLYIDGNISSSSGNSLTAEIDGAGYDNSGIKLGSGFDYETLDPYGISHYKIIVIDGCPTDGSKGSFRVWINHYDVSS